MTGTIENQLNTYIERLNKAQKKSLLGFLKSAFPGAEEKPYTIEDYNKELAEAEAEIARGECYTHAEVKDLLKEIINRGK